MLGLGPKAPAAHMKLKLPQVNAFVDFMMAGGGPRGSVCVESMQERNFAVGALPGTKVGGTAVFSYANPVGRFRFSTKCVAMRGSTAVFAVPDRVETLQIFSGAQKRAAVRIDATVSVQWRFAPEGKAVGDYARGSLTDISRSGASLNVDREVRKGTFVEMRFALGTAAPLVLLGEVMRSSAIESSKRVSLGLRFHGMKPEEDRAIMEFINKRQADRRHRGLA
jgi:hypothetical protein